MDAPSYYELDEDAARQSINASTIYAEYRRTLEAARPYMGGMYWKKVGAYEYLTKTGKGSSQTSVGPRGERTEAIYADFQSRKAPLMQRLEALEASLVQAERYNKAAKAGRVPNNVVAVLRAIERHGLGDNFTVVGTHALFAYEAAAGVRIVEKALATVDVDLLWDARKRVQFETTVKRLDRSVLSILQEADKSFTRMELQKETAVNDKGFQVDFLRRIPEGKDPHPYRLTDDLDDMWPVQARRANILTEAPRFAYPVISQVGEIALMRTVSPQVFIQFKEWMSREPTRDPLKRSRDRLQAQIVQQLLDEQRLIA